MDRVCGKALAGVRTLEVGHEGRVTLGLEGDLVNDLCLLEVEREVGGEDASLDDAQRRFVVVL